MVKVLIVDDEYFIRYGLEHMVDWEEYGIEICGSVSNGLEALEVIDDKEPEIVITDIRMPEMDGIGLLEAIRESHRNIKVIVISGYNDFGYVKQALKYGVENYILKPIDEDELSETILATLDSIEKEEEANLQLKERRNYIIDNVFNRLMSNSIAIKEFEERLEFFGRTLSASHYFVTLIQIIESEDHDMVMLKKQALASVKEQYDDVEVHIFFDLDGSIVLLFALEAKHLQAKLEKDLSKVIHELNETLDADVFITCGQGVGTLEEVHTSYTQAKKLQEYIYIYSVNTKVSHSRIASVKESTGALVAQDVDQLTEAILTGNRHEVESFFMDLKAAVNRLSGVELNHVRSFMIELIAELIHITKEKELWNEKEGINPEKLYEKLFGESDLMSTIQWLRKRALRIVEVMISKNSQPLSLQQKVLQHIEDNYDKELSLKILASEFYVNTSYLGQQIKKETGKLFSAYLNELRIEKAKELLESTNMKASHVAKKVGYSDANYFYKVFKKYAGVYPSEYN